VDGSQMPAAATDDSRLLIDGDRFRMVSPEATYDGVFTIDVDAKAPRIDIEFVDGPEAGTRSEGLYELKTNVLTLCLGLAGAPRPKAFATSRGSGHALERLRRVSNARSANVTGGARTSKPVTPRAAVTAVDPSTFDVPMTPMMRRLEGEWAPVELVMDGKPMPDEWLAYGSRTMTGNEMKVVFGGQTMAHARVRIDERASPIAVEYLNLHGSVKGAVSLGIMEWIGDEVRFLMAAPGEPRPRDFAALSRTATLSRWRKRVREQR
ncbi:MAG TPA: TIGR03067 domain-containing protein, partial [Vicinamibacterales bacterium]